MSEKKIERIDEKEEVVKELEGVIQAFIEVCQSCCDDKNDCREIIKWICDNIVFDREGFIVVKFPEYMIKNLFLAEEYRIPIERGAPTNLFAQLAPHINFHQCEINLTEFSEKEINLITGFLRHTLTKSLPGLVKKISLVKYGGKISGRVKYFHRSDACLKNYPDSNLDDLLRDLRRFLR